MPDGEQLAGVMTDDWIKGGYHRWNGSFDDDPTMIALYGPNWRTRRPKVRETFFEASRFLETILPLSKVGGIGVSCAKEADGPRKIEPDEWATLELELTRNLLATPNGKRLEDFPAIRSIRVRAEDLRREWRKKQKASGEKNKGGAPYAADWPTIQEALEAEINDLGFPCRDGAEGWRYQEDVVRFIERRCGDNEPGKSSLKRHAKEMLESIRRKKGQKLAS
jgi:hypothetical protein